jgi:hypothetical protein
MSTNLEELRKLAQSWKLIMDEGHNAVVDRLTCTGSVDAHDIAEQFPGVTFQAAVFQPDYRDYTMHVWLVDDQFYRFGIDEWDEDPADVVQVGLDKLRAMGSPTIWSQRTSPNPNEMDDEQQDD